MRRRFRWLPMLDARTAIAQARGASIDPGALVDYYPSSSAYYYNSRTYSTEAAFWAALGGVDSGSAKVIGPYDDPTATELLSNGSFTSNTTGWTGYNSMALASVGGELQMTVSGNLSAVTQALTGLISRGFKFVSTLRRGTTGNSIAPVATINNNSASSGIFGTNVSSTSPSTQTIYAATITAGTMWVGARCTSAAADGGTFLGDNFSMIEAWPAPSWPRTDATFVLWGTTPAVASGNKVLYQEGSASERDRIRLVWDASSHLQWIITGNNAVQATFDMGVVAANTAFRTVLACTSNSMNASLNGVLSTQDIACSKPGATHAWLKRSYTGETWDGSVERWAVLPSRVVDSYSQHLSSGHITNAIWGEGDSYMAGSGGVVLNTTLASTASRLVISTAVGGSTMADIYARVAAAPYLRNRTFVLWDGSSNGLATVAGYLAEIDQIVQALGHSRFLIIPPVTPSATTPVSAAGSQTTADVRDGLIAAYGASHVLDSLPVLATVATSPGDDAWVTYGYIPPSLMIDTVHLNQTAMNAIATAITTRLTANAW